MAATPQPPQGGNSGGISGISIPQWLIQLIPIVAILVAAVVAFAQQRATVEQTRESLIELKKTQKDFVEKELFNVKMKEVEKLEDGINKRFDKIETMLNSLSEKIAESAYHRKRATSDGNK